MDFIQLIHDDLAYNSSHEKWLPSIRQIHRAIRKSGNSAMGPSGIPFAADRCCAVFTAIIFHNFLRDLIDPRTPILLIPRALDHARLTMLSKDVLTVLDDGRAGFAAYNLRPLSLVNCYNRIMANGFRMDVAKVVGPLVQLRQHGFLKMRLMVENIIDIEWEAVKVMYNYSKGAIVVFDFKAAFPSLDHECMWEVLKIGFLACVIGLFRAFYIDSLHNIWVEGEIFDSGLVSAGVRQGCPLSPLLFVLCIEPFLTRLEERIPEIGIRRAFADDIGMVVKYAPSGWLPLVRESECFGAVSNLCTNIKKMVCIPLWYDEIENIRGLAWYAFSRWAEVPGSFKSKQTFGLDYWPPSSSEGLIIEAYQQTLGKSVGSEEECLPSLKQQTFGIQSATPSLSSSTRAWSPTMLPPVLPSKRSSTWWAARATGARQSSAFLWKLPCLASMVSLPAAGTGISSSAQKPNAVNLRAPASPALSRRWQYNVMALPMKDTLARLSSIAYRQWTLWLLRAQLLSFWDELVLRYMRAIEDSGPASRIEHHDW